VPLSLRGTRRLFDAFTLLSRDGFESSTSRSDPNLKTHIGMKRESYIQCHARKNVLGTTRAILYVAEKKDKWDKALGCLELKDPSIRSDIVALHILATQSRGWYACVRTPTALPTSISQDQEFGGNTTPLIETYVRINLKGN
jgi:hypothetical protein